MATTMKFLGYRQWRRVGHGHCFKTVKEKYVFMAQYRSIFSVEAMSRILSVSRSGFYDWMNRGESKRDLSDRDLYREILKIFRESHGTYGRPRICAELKNRMVEIPRKLECVQGGACIVQCPLDALSFIFPKGEIIGPDTIRKFKLNLLAKRYQKSGY